MATLPPIIQTPSSKFGCMAQGTLGRAGNRVLGWVDHHIVGPLSSADYEFITRPISERQASAHFGIGHINGALVIHQYVDLADTAWANGLVDYPTWAVTIGRPNVNPNLYTVSVEHEDAGGRNGSGATPADVWAASMALTRLCTSGNLASIRSVGIRISDRPGKTAQDLADELAAIPKSTLGFVDHHQITRSKTYCWRRWLDDPGFVDGSPSRRDQLIEYLRGGVSQLPDTAEGQVNIIKDVVRFDPPRRWTPKITGTINGYNARGELVKSNPMQVGVSGASVAAVVDFSGDNVPGGYESLRMGEVVDGYFAGLYVNLAHITGFSLDPDVVQVPSGITQEQLDAATTRADKIKGDYLKHLNTEILRAQTEREVAGKL